jgi:hypothetical protein
VIVSIHEKRDEFRNMLKGHGGYPGHAGARAAVPPAPLGEKAENNDGTVDAPGGTR